MKKTIGKTVLIVCICALLIFLLLPFLETQEPSAKADKKASPQIFTSNPLTELVNRIAAIFQSKEKRLAKKAAAAQAEAQAAKDALNELYADTSAQAPARYAATQADDTQGQAQTTTFTNANFDYGNAALQDEDGNWILVRQTAPDAPARGMHEINTTDDAYERYIRQEKAARSTPGLGAPTRPADSALARLLAPIKGLFGIKQNSTAQLPADATASAVRAPAANTVKASQGLGSNNGKEPSSSLPARPTLPSIPAGLANAVLPVQAAGNAGANTAQYSAADMLNPMLAITRASEWIQENQDPEATDEEKQQNNEKLKNMIYKTRAELSDKLTKQVQEEAGNAPAPNHLPTTIGCRGESGSFYSAEGAPCANLPSVAQDPGAWLSADEQDKLAQQGKQKLMEKLNLPAGHPAVPDVNMLVVLGKTKNILPPDMEENDEDTPEQKQAKEITGRIYELMLEKQNCTKEECYWIPNQLQQYPSVRETVLSAGFNSIEDPLKLYDQWVPQLQAELMDETAGDQTGMQFIDMSKVLSTNAPAYIPITREQMQALNRRNDDRKLMNPETRKDHIVFYVPDPQNAREMIDVFREHPAFLVWGKDGKVFDRSANMDTSARADMLQNDVTQRAKDMAEFAKGVVQELYQENLIDTSRRQTKKISNMNATQATQQLQKNIQGTQKPAGSKVTNSKIPGLQFKELKL